MGLQIANEDQVFIVADSVVSVIVLFVGSQDLKGFNVEVRQQGETPVLINPFNTLTANNLVATQPPASLTWERGEHIYNDTPAAGGNIGWVCVTAGTGGSTAVFKEFGVIES